MLEESLLRKEERVIFTLRKLYRDHGYEKYKMSKFEEYDLYSRNKDFLVSDGVITFTDADGSLLALKPDVTLSILKNFKERKGTVRRLCYDENVYRISETSHTYKEIMQTGLECMGDIGKEQVTEVASLAAKSLERISEDFMLFLSHVGLLTAILDAFALEGGKRELVCRAIQEKSKDSLLAVCTESEFSGLSLLTEHFKDAAEALKRLKPLCTTLQAVSAEKELCAVYEKLKEQGYGDRVNIDFSAVDSTAYYSGIVFKGYINGLPSRILSGGRYDTLMKKMGRDAGAIGFAVYLDALERFEKKQDREGAFLNIALPKGRLGEKVYRMFEEAGFECPSIRESNRKLTFENKELGIRYFWVKPSDVAIYVERGAADLGVAGKDILLEYQPDVYELLDLKVGKCRMAVAAERGFRDDTSRTLRVATKFTNIARKFYAEKCRDIDIIHLNGSIELAPLLGLTDVIVDIVETGKTLAENNLEPIEDVAAISARLIANRAGFSFKAGKILKIKEKLEQRMAQKHD